MQCSAFRFLHFAGLVLCHWPEGAAALELWWVRVIVIVRFSIILQPVHCPLGDKTSALVTMYMHSACRSKAIFIFLKPASNLPATRQQWEQPGPAGHVYFTPKLCQNVFWLSDSDHFISNILANYFTLVTCNLQTWIWKSVLEMHAIILFGSLGSW